MVLVDKKSFEEKFAKQIQYINGNPALSMEEKKAAIDSLSKPPSDSPKDTKKKD